MNVRQLLEQHLPLVAQQTADPNYVAVSVDDLRQLWELAHEAVHPSEDSGLSAEDDTQLRMHCLQLATQVDLGRMHAAQGGPWASDPLMLAEAYYHFLKGESD